MSEDLFRDLASIEADLAAKKLRYGSTTITYAEGLGHKRRAEAFTAEADRLAPAPPPPPPVPDPPPPPPPPPPSTGDVTVFDGRGVDRIVHTQEGGLLPNFRVVGAAYPAAPAVEIVGLRCRGTVELRDGLVSTQGMGITSQGSSARLTATRVRAQGFGGDPGYVGGGLYGWYVQSWFDLTDCSNGPATTGLKSHHGFHGYMENGPIVYGRLTRYRDEHSGDLLVASPGHGVHRVEIVDLYKPVGKVGLGIYEDGPRNHVAVMRGDNTQVSRVSFDGEGWDEIDVVLPSGVSIERNGDTIASGQRNWDGCLLVKINGRVVHSE